jgi:hypothetical protein
VCVLDGRWNVCSSSVQLLLVANSPLSFNRTNIKQTAAMCLQVPFGPFPPGHSQ